MTTPMSSPSAEAYPHLRTFLGAWFHQDFDLVGESLEEIVSAFNAASSPSEAQHVRSDIDAFVQDARHDLDEAFVRVFNPEVDPHGWGMTTREWLMRIRDLLKS
jgi:hypothetical protein